MELMDAIYQRRAVRQYNPGEIPPEIVWKLLAAAVQAPSPLNFQPWSFAVFSGAERLAGYSARIKEFLAATLPPLYEMFEHTSHMNQPGYNVFHSAPVLVVICAKSQGYNPNEACAMAAQNLLLAAHGFGLATCPVGFVRAWLRLPEIKRELGIPHGHDPVFPLVLGYPAAESVRVDRRPPEVIVWKRPDDPV